MSNPIDGILDGTNKPDWFEIDAETEAILLQVQASFNVPADLQFPDTQLVRRILDTVVGRTHALNPGLQVDGLNYKGVQDDVQIFSITIS